MRIVVVGTSGSGKTTMAKRLAIVVLPEPDDPTTTILTFRPV